jgi:gamma-glutamyltranspeptidase / glutathione hydrolase
MRRVVRGGTIANARAGVRRVLCVLLLAASAVAILLPGPARAYAGAVASPDRYGADTAEEVLRAGGNAVDATVAVAFTLAVTYPGAGNLGGGGFATVYFRGKPYFLDYRERAPAAATSGMYLDANGAVVPGASTVGARAVAVPGTVLGLWQLHHRFGVLPWRRLMQPAIRYARDGFIVSELLSRQSADTVATLAGRTNFAAYFGAIKPNTTLRQPELAATLERIAHGGVREFYGGETARLIVAQMARGHGLVTAQDLAAYRAIWRAPLEADWAGYRIITAPPPSSGGIALVALLKMKAAIAPLFAGVPLNSPQYVHLLAELEKPVFADRAEYLGDPDFYAVPVARLTDDAYLAARARIISTDRPTATAAVSAGLQDHHNTTHFSVVDRSGNAVSNTFTLNDDFGSGLVVEGAGFLLNNEMDDFSAKPGTPNMYGVVGGDANAIAPGKTPLSSMTPTILTQNGKVALVIGTPGGSRIFTSVFQVIANWHDFGLPLGEAVGALRVHHQLLPPDTIFEEPYRQLDPATRQALEARGYRFENQGFNGDVEAIEVGARGATAAADPRGTGVGRVIK